MPIWTFALQRTFLVPGEGDFEARDVHDDEVPGRDLVQDPSRPLEVDPDLKDARLDGDVQLRERARPDGAVGRQAMPRLELLDRGGERLVEGLAVERLSRELPGRREAAPERRDPRVLHSRLEFLAGGDRGPPAAGGQGAVPGERGASPLVPPVVGADLRYGLLQPALHQRVAHDGERGRIADRPQLEVPLRIEPLRIHLAEIQVIEQENERVGREQIALRPRRRVNARGLERRRELRERGLVVILGPESVLCRFPHELEQHVQPVGCPEGPVTVLLIEDGQGVARQDLRSSRLDASGRLKLVEPLAQDFGDRAGILRPGHGRAARPEESQKARRHADRGPSNLSHHFGPVAIIGEIGPSPLRDIDRLDIHELLDPVRRELAAIAALLDAAEGEARIGPDGLVDEDAAAFDQIRGDALAASRDRASGRLLPTRTPSRWRSRSPLPRPRPG